MRRAFLADLASTRQEILISLVLMFSMFTPALPKALNILKATPACVRMPPPTMATFAR